MTTSDRKRALETKRRGVGLTRDEADELGRIYAVDRGELYGNADQLHDTDGGDAIDEAVLPADLQATADDRASEESKRALAPGEQIDASIDVDATPEEAFDRWSRVEEFPTFMDGVELVERPTPRTLRWITEVGGQRREWAALITEDRRGEEMAWVSTAGVVTEARVRFDAVGEGSTRVHLSLYVAPPESEDRDRMLADLRTLVQRDLEQFRKRVHDARAA
jgi:uncharacterized membrane protein